MKLILYQFNSIYIMVAVPFVKSGRNKQEKSKRKKISQGDCPVASMSSSYHPSGQKLCFLPTKLTIQDLGVNLKVYLLSSCVDNISIFANMYIFLRLSGRLCINDLISGENWTIQALNKRFSFNSFHCILSSLCETL